MTHHDYFLYNISLGFGNEAALVMKKVILQSSDTVGVCQSYRNKRRKLWKRTKLLSGQMRQVIQKERNFLSNSLDIRIEKQEVWVTV